MIIKTARQASHLPHSNGRAQQTPLQKWQRPCLLSQVLHSGVIWPFDHFSLGMRSFAWQKSQKLPVRLPQSTQGRLSISGLPHAITSRGHASMLNLLVSLQREGLNIRCLPIASLDPTSQP